MQQFSLHSAYDPGQRTSSTLAAMFSLAKQQGKNAWHGGSVPGIQLQRWHHMLPSLCGVVPHAHGVCVRTLSTIMLKKII